MIRYCIFILPSTRPFSCWPVGPITRRFLFTAAGMGKYYSNWPSMIWPLPLHFSPKKRLSFCRPRRILFSKLIWQTIVSQKYPFCFCWKKAIRARSKPLTFRDCFASDSRACTEIIDSNWPTMPILLKRPASRRGYSKASKISGLMTTNCRRATSCQWCCGSNRDRSMTSKSRCSVQKLESIGKSRWVWTGWTSIKIWSSRSSIFGNCQSRDC